MRKLARVWCALVATLVILLLARPGWCNGCYIPDVATEKMPSIPVQRALITYRDGVETLAVESGVQTESASVGWILPLPETPTSIAKGEPGMLVSVSMALRPHFVHDLRQPWELPLGILALLALPLLAIVFTRDAAARRQRAIEYLCVSAFVALIFSCLLPSLSRAGESTVGSGGIELLSSQRVGNFSVDVLSARSADDLQAWLRQNHLRDLSAQARDIVVDYIARGWRFAVARLDVAPGIACTPHPLVFSFATKTPVFPMKLTALAGSKTHVELIVAADQRAQANGFHLAFCDKFARGSDGMTCPSGLVIAHPEVVKRLWSDCIVSKLQADLEPAAMTQDVTIGFLPFAQHRDEVYTPQGRNEVVGTIIAWGLLPTCVILAIACSGMRRPSRGAKLAILGVLVATGLTALVFAFSVEVRSDVNIRKHGRIADFRTAASILAAINDVALTMYADDPTLGEKVIHALQVTEDARRNELQGGDRRWERSPGNLYLTDTDELAVYDLDTVARELSARLPRHTHASQPATNETR